MKYDYVWEKFHLAVNGLASSQRPLQERIADAYVYHLIHLRRHELPAEIRDDFAELNRVLTSEQAKGDEGNVAASAAVLGEVEAHRVIDSIVSMYDRVARYGPNGAG
jgi:hypothetical protein